MFESFFTKPAQPIEDKEVKEFLSSLNFKEIVDKASQENLPQEYLQFYKMWLQTSQLNSISGLNAFAHQYVCQGVTQAIDEFISRHRQRRIRFFRGEYPYHRDVLNLTQRQWLWLEEAPLSEQDAVIISHPFSGSGEEHESLKPTLEACEKLNVPVFLDCAFFGICRDISFTLNHKAIESVAFSLSKIFFLGKFRTGILFSRVPCGSIHIQNSWAYVNRIGATVGLYLMRNFCPDYVVNKYSTAQEQLCRQFRLSASKTVIFGIGDSEYAEFSRDGAFNRVCLSRALTF